MRQCLVLRESAWDYTTHYSRVSGSKGLVILSKPKPAKSICASSRPKDDHAVFKSAHSNCEFSIQCYPATYVTNPPVATISRTLVTMAELPRRTASICPLQPHCFLPDESRGAWTGVNLVLSSGISMIASFVSWEE